MKNTSLNKILLLCTVLVGTLSLSGCEITSIRAEEYKSPIDLTQEMNTNNTFSQSAIQLSTIVYPQEYTETYILENTYQNEDSDFDESLEEWEKIANETLKIQHIQDIGEHIIDQYYQNGVVYDIEYPLFYNDAVDFVVGNYIEEKINAFNVMHEIEVNEMTEMLEELDLELRELELEIEELELELELEIEELQVEEETTSDTVDYIFHITYDVYSLPNDEISIIFYETEIDQETKEQTERIHSLLINEVYGYVLPKEAYLFTEAEDAIVNYFVENLRTYIVEYFTNSVEYEEFIDIDYSEIFNEEYSLFEHIGKTNHGIVVSFDSGTIFPNEEGAVTIVILEETITQLKEEAVTTKEAETVGFVEKENGEIQLPYLRREGQIDPSKPMVALTIDDGPSPLYTPRILSVLEQYDAVATFYDVGSLVDRYPEIVRQQYDSGSELGYHSYNHDNFKNFTANQMLADMAKNKAAYMKAVGGLPTTFRPPYGAWDKEVLQTIDVALVNWSVDTMDWKSRNVNSIMNIIYSEGNLDGKVILMHGIYESSVQAIEILVPYLVEKGYQLVTVSELINERYGVLPQAGEFYGYNEFS